MMVAEPSGDESALTSRAHVAPAGLAPAGSAAPDAATPDVTAFLSTAVQELTEVTSHVTESQLQDLAAAVVAARSVFLSGAGRSGLVSRAIAMRLMHIGISAYAVGEVATPAITSEDLLVVLSARGSKSITAQVDAATALGARTAAISSSATTEVAAACGIVLIVPARTQVDSVQHAGSLFEQASLVVGDAVCRAVQTSLGVPTSVLNARHANLS